MAELDLSADREYETPEDARLDAALVEAVEAARGADEEYLATLLETELASFYHGTRLGR